MPEDESSAPKQDDIAAAFRDPDRAAQPDALLRFLDSVSSDAGIQAAKRENLALLRLQPGDRVLDAGCGTGEDVLALADLVGPTGLALGIDRSEHMLAAASQRARASGNPGAGRARFAVADVLALPFAAGTFNGVYAERLLTYVPDPEAALAELIRVTRTGARVVVSDLDLGAQVFDVPERELFRAFWEYRQDRAVPNAWIGRQLPRLFHAAGLSDLTITPRVYVAWRQPPAEFVRQMRVQVEHAISDGALSPAEGQHWLASMDARIAEGTWFNTFNHFVVAGTRVG